MKKVICVYVCIFLAAGCGNGKLHDIGSSANSVVDKSGVDKSDINKKISKDTTPPTSEPLLNPLEELCGDGNYKPYLWHSVISYIINAVIFLPLEGITVENYTDFATFFGILRMFSTLSFPVHVAFTNLSFLFKSKISLASLALDAFLSLSVFILNEQLITYQLLNYIFSNNSIYFLVTQFFLESVRLLAYPHLLFL